MEIAEAMNCTPKSPMSFAIRGFIWGMGYGIELALVTEGLADENKGTIRTPVLQSDKRGNAGGN